MLVGEVFARMGLDSTNYEKELGRLEGVTNRQATTLGTVFKGAFSVALGIGVFEAVRRGLGKLTGTVISYNAQMQQAQIGFTTMLGSADRAAVFLEDLADFAAKTPFEFPELLDASKRMLAYGFEAGRVLPIMEAVGNATAGLGMGADGINRIILALGQMRAKGKLSGEEMRQLTEAGIPAWEMLANAMGKTTAEIMDMQQKGLIPADKAIDMIIEGMNKKFPDMMKNMENTWEGVTSTIKDVWNMTIGAIGENLFKGLLSWLQGVRDFATDFYAVFRKQGLQQAIQQSFGPEIAALVSILTAVMRGFAAIVRTATGFIQQYGTQLKFVVTVMATYYTLTKALAVAQWALVAATAAEKGQLLAKIPILNVVGTAMGIYRVQMALAAQQGMVLTGVVARLRVALFSLWSALGPIGWIILGISAAAGIGIHMWGNYTKSLQEAKSLGFGDFRKAQEGISSSTEDSSGALEDQADAMKKAGKAAAKNLQPFDEINQLQKDAAGAGSDLADALSIGDISMGAMDLPSLDAGMGLTGDLDQAKPTLAGFWDYLKQGAVEAWDKVKAIASESWDMIKAKWAEADPWFQVLATIIGVVLVTAFAKLGIAAIINGAKVVASFVAQAAAAIAQGAIVIGQIALMVAKWAWAGVQFLAHAAKMAAAWFIALGPIGWIIAAVIALATLIIYYWDDIKKWTIKTWEEVSRWLADTWEGIKKKAEDIWKSIKDFFQTTWDGIKQTTEYTWNGIVTFLQNVWDGIKTTAVNIWNAIIAFFTTTWNNLKQSVSNTFNSIKTTISNAWTSIKTTVATLASSIQSAMLDPFQSSKIAITSIISDAKNWGKNMVSNIVSGITSKISDVKNAASKVARTIKSYIGFSSPTEQGPGKTADKWAPNLISMYAQGILQNSGMVQGAVGVIAGQLAGLSSTDLALPGPSPFSSTKSAENSSGDVYVYIGNEQIDAYIYRSQDKRNIRSNGR